jgi:hypothetical protein
MGVVDSDGVAVPEGGAVLDGVCVSEGVRVVEGVAREGLALAWAGVAVEACEMVAVLDGVAWEMVEALAGVVVTVLEGVTVVAGVVVLAGVAVLAWEAELFGVNRMAAAEAGLRMEVRAAAGAGVARMVEGGAVAVAEAAAWVMSAVGATGVARRREPADLTARKPGPAPHGALVADDGPMPALVADAVRLLGAREGGERTRARVACREADEDRAAERREGGQRR